MLFKLTIVCLVGLTLAQDYDEYQPRNRPAPARLQPGNGATDVRPTPIPILKQINKHNEDGSYTYGYEGADGSFKIETKSATGEVKGKYGYVDEGTGKVRVVEYGANKYGFQPSGEGITVAPPTLVDETTNKDGLQISDYDYEQPEPVRPSPKQYIARVPKPQQPQGSQRPQRPQPQFIDYQQSEPEQQQQQQPQYTAPSQPRQHIPNSQPIDVVYSSRPRPVRPDPEYSQTQTFFPNTQEIRESQPSYNSPSPAAGRSSYSAPKSSPPQPIQYSAPRLTQSPQPQQSQQQYQPQQHHQQQQQQQQQQHHQQQQQQQQQYQPPQGRSTSVLDQLAKDYALPQGGSAALHDISFGYY